MSVLTFALQVRPGGFEDRQEDGEQLHQVSGDVARRRLVVHHVQGVEGLQRTDTLFFITSNGQFPLKPSRTAVKPHLLTSVISLHRSYLGHEDESSVEDHQQSVLIVL